MTNINYIKTNLKFKGIFNIIVMQNFISYFMLSRYREKEMIGSSVYYKLGSQEFGIPSNITEQNKMFYIRKYNDQN